MAKLIAVLCLALAIAAAPSVQAGFWSNLTDKAEEVRKEVTTRVEQAIEKIQEAIEDAKDYVADRLEEAEKAAEETAKKMLHEFNDYVNKAKEAITDAEKQGRDVADCVEKEEALERLVDEVTVSVTSCVSNEVTDTKDEMNDIYEYSQQAIQELREIIVKMDDCEGITCYAKVGAQAGVKTGEAVAKVTAKAVALKFHIKKRVATLPLTCGQEVVPGFMQELKQAVQDVKDCLAENTDEA